MGSKICKGGRRIYSILISFVIVLWVLIFVELLESLLKLDTFIKGIFFSLLQLKERGVNFLLSFSFVNNKAEHVSYIRYDCCIYILNGPHILY